MVKKTLAEQVNIVMATLTQDIQDNKLELPSPPDLLLKIRRLTAEADTTSEDIANLIKHDINISGRLIKVANSALFGDRAPAKTPHAAISRLGQYKVQSLVIGLSIGQKLLEAKLYGLESYCKQAWQSSNNIAAIASALASLKSNIDPDYALLAGLVHNIGMLPIILKLNKIDALQANPEVMKLVANVVIPKLYPRAGKLILQSWNFPSDMIAVATHHTTNEQSIEHLPANLADLIYIAHQLNSIDIINTTPMSLPYDLINSAAFKKLWTNEEQAIADLVKLNEGIRRIKYDITH